MRLDSGDLAELSKRVRRILDREGLDYVRILASNDLNEEKIAHLRAKGAPIDGYGVGTEMITAKPVAAISGVYKLVEDGAGAKIKLSEGKATYPGSKQVHRYYNPDGIFSHDLLALDSEPYGGAALLEAVVRNGARVSSRRPLPDIRRYALASIGRIPAALKAVHTTASYLLRISPGLRKLTKKLTDEHQQRKCVERNNAEYIPLQAYGGAS